MLTCVALLWPHRAIASPTARAPAIPDTRAGHTLELWLYGFNSGERTRIAAFTKAHASWVNLDWLMKARAATGGYDLIAIEFSQPTEIIVRLKERSSAHETLGRIQSNRHRSASGDPIRAVLDPGRRPF